MRALLRCFGSLHVEYSRTQLFDRVWMSPLGARQILRTQLQTQSLSLSLKVFDFGFGSRAGHIDSTARGLAGCRAGAAALDS